MPNPIIAQLEIWYNEPIVGLERPNMLSKLAVLELCGSLETEQDKIILKINDACLNSRPWTQTEIIDRNYGFDYGKHFRPMLVKLLGEHLVRRVEQIMDVQYPGDLDMFRSLTGDLWKKRCNFAHNDLATNIVKQHYFNAPNWCQIRYGDLIRVLGELEIEAINIASAL